MKDIKLEINIQYCQVDELSEEDRELVTVAKEATQNSYAKYSHFCVGAAIRLGDGRIIKGANQENAAFPSGLCAERTAVFAAQANYPEQPITTLAIAAKNEYGFTGEPVTPCGSCRQVMLEIEDRYQQPVKILLYGTHGVYALKSIKDLMPLCFVDENMHK
ncbi:cytidine deaminase [Prevotella sp. KH2C16]|uniref:cytidine deaminase n=1 Tax=Prevotella sp. KH2C16 TaxID=1855325 RepID=UPI0008E39E2B|nr:cytidine deaminase [Prevotella sp. KH2C16]SFF94375.1 cytidine deaminase [Prevotella sp. KH2C16]